MVVVAGAVAVIEYEPAMAFAVTVAEAVPSEPVVAVIVAVPFVNTALAPLAGAVKTTETPGTGLPPFVTVATKGLLNAIVRFADCVLPLVAAITFGLEVLLLLLLQPVHSPVPSTSTRNKPIEVWRFIVPLPSVPPIAGTAATPARHAHSELNKCGPRPSPSGPA